MNGRGHAVACPPTSRPQTTPGERRHDPPPVDDRRLDLARATEWWAAIDSFDPRHEPWRSHELLEGERIEGQVVRLPAPGVFNGNKLFLRQPSGEVIAIPATADRGHTVLERSLHDLAISPGDWISIRYAGKRSTADGERTYRFYEAVRHG